VGDYSPFLLARRWCMWCGAYRRQKPRNEHMSAGPPPIADIARRDWHCRVRPSAFAVLRLRSVSYLTGALLCTGQLNCSATNSGLWSGLIFFASAIVSREYGALLNGSLWCGRGRTRKRPTRVLTGSVTDGMKMTRPEIDTIGPLSCSTFLFRLAVTPAASSLRRRP
jgi:hypothetical protein